MSRQPAHPLAVSGGYDAIAAPVFGSVKADRLLLEHDDERSGTSDPLRLAPVGKVVVLGAVTTKRSPIEPLEQIEARLGTLGGRNPTGLTAKARPEARPEARGESPQ